MRVKIFVIVVFLIGLGLLSLKSKNQVPISPDKTSPLAIANKVIPELMGKHTNNYDSNSKTADQQLNYEVEKFRDYLKTSYVRLPNVQSLRLTQNNDVHRIPPEVLESSEVFGYISDKLKSNPTLVKDALSFYNACAANEQFITAIRAVCARNLIDWAKKANIDISRAQIPEKILQIAIVLPERS